MGIYLQFDLSDPLPLASIKGSGDLMDWVSTLPEETAMGLRHLLAYGWVENLEAVEGEIADALVDSPPSRDDTKQTCKNLLKMFRERGNESIVATITDGLSE